MADVTLRIWRGDANGGDFENYTTEPVSYTHLTLPTILRV